MYCWKSLFTSMFSSRFLPGASKTDVFPLGVFMNLCLNPNHPTTKWGEKPMCKIPCAKYLNTLNLVRVYYYINVEYIYIYVSCHYKAIPGYVSLVFACALGVFKPASNSVDMYFQNNQYNIIKTSNKANVHIAFFHFSTHPHFLDVPLP